MLDFLETVPTLLSGEISSATVGFVAVYEVRHQKLARSWYNGGEACGARQGPCHKGMGVATGEMGWRLLALKIRVGDVPRFFLKAENGIIREHGLFLRMPRE